MKLTKRVCDDESEVEVTVIDYQQPDETSIGFENRLIDTLNKLLNVSEVLKDEPVDD